MPEDEYIDPEHFTYMTAQLDDDAIRRFCQYMQNYVAASHALGHTTPTSTYMYVAATTDPMSQLTCDLWRASNAYLDSGAGADEARARLAEFMWNSGTMHSIAATA